MQKCFLLKINNEKKNLHKNQASGIMLQNVYSEVATFLNLSQFFQLAPRLKKGRHLETRPLIFIVTYVLSLTMKH